MSTCEHGYTAFFDCPHCLCPGCEQPMDGCVCHELARQAEEAERLQELERAARAAGEVS